MSKNLSIVEYYQQLLNNPGRPTSEEMATRQMSTFYKIMGNLPNPDPILKKAGKDIKVYENLLYDDQVGMCVEALELAIQAQPWEIDHNGASDVWVKEIEAMMEDWDHERIFTEATSARLYGYQPMEVLWKAGNSVWSIKDIVGKPPEWFFFDGENRLQLRQRNNMQGIAADHQSMPYKFILPRNKPSYKNPYGVAALSRCFWPVAFKKGGLKFWLKFVEKYGMPYLIGKQPRGAGEEATDTLLDMLEAMVQDAVAVIPDDSSVEILDSAKGASGDLFERHVKYHDGAIAKAVLGQTLTSSSGDDGSGSYALGKVHLQVFDNVKDGTAKLVKKVYDTAFQWLTDVNNGGPAPKFKWIAEEDVQKDRAERDKTLKETGVRFKKKYFAGRYNLEEDEFELEDEHPNKPEGFSHGGKVPACPCGCSGDPIVHFENEMEAEFPDQAAIDAAGKDSPGRKRMMQRQAGQTVQPVIDMIRQSSSFEEAFEKLAGLYPDMDTEELEKRLSRAIFVSEVYGRLTAKKEAEEDES